MGEFAGVLPDYHKPDIMTLITSYMASSEGEEGGGEAVKGDRVKRHLSIKGTGRYCWTLIEQLL